MLTRSLAPSSPDGLDSRSSMASTPRRQGKDGIFDQPSAASNGLFDDDASDSRHDDSSPWDMPTPRRLQSRAHVIGNILSASDVPTHYAEVFETVVRHDGHDGRVTASAISKLFATSRLAPESQVRIMSLLGQSDDASHASLGPAEFNVLLALIGLAQEGEVISLDGVDERRKNLPLPKLPGLTAEPMLPPVAELSAKLPAQTPPEPRPESPPKILATTMDDPEDDPWNTPELHRGHNHGPSNPGGNPNSAVTNGHNDHGGSAAMRPAMSHLANSASAPDSDSSKPISGDVPGQGGWGGYFAGGAGGAGDGINNASPGAAFGDRPNHTETAPFGGDSSVDRALINPPSAPTTRNASGRTGSGVEEQILVTLMPEKEGIFLFQHHNYEVASQRRGSKVVRRYSDFVWLLDCLHKRYPFRVLPLLPPKRVAVNGNHLSNDGAFIEKRRRGLARFLNALVRHPVLSQEQLVVMFLTVPTELAVWRKQATISVQDEFTDRPLPPGLEESLPPTVEDLFLRTRSGVRRSAELYISVCNIMDRLVKRTEGVAADHARIAMMLGSLTEASADTYATDVNEVPLLNDGLLAMSKHLRTCQTLLEDESRGWDEGVLEDLKRQRDALVSVRDLFERRERLDRDNIPYLERRIQANETKLANLRSKPDGVVKAGELDKVAESIIKDKESIVRQHNRTIFVKECMRDELITFQSTQYHVSRWSQDWAGERIKYAEMLADNWRRLMDELEGMPLGD
ncbi:hypothetical protein CDD82_840 [Ophiocordyceps australis]|uniref:Sorting nexin MVP1 n=1 Tax=Ophiocordyceps australis TaxID=1399860 RepID=A0A2C5YTG9_9HYPO|nr:hypothetical protein CDD82_840 [Ophiocordyceps australis]